MTQVQRVGGGDGRGSQAPGVLTFGLGPYTTALVTVTWPDGSVNSFTATGDAPSPDPEFNSSTDP